MRSFERTTIQDRFSAKNSTSAGAMITRKTVLRTELIPPMVASQNSML